MGATVLDIYGDLIPAEDDPQPPRPGGADGHAPLRHGLPGPVLPGQYLHGAVAHTLAGRALKQAILRVGAPHQLQQGLLLLGELQGADGVVPQLLPLVSAPGAAARQEQGARQGQTK